ncbi:MAG: UvrD-helicase domain-containing protein, partial [Chthoniobacterales bacterium]
MIAPRDPSASLGMTEEFDAAQTSLEGGFTVIEASAGTGKTTTISAIVLRLLVEKQIPIEEILVATYTELATAELRGRIRQIMADALQTLRGGEATLPFVGEIVAKISDSKQAAHKLETALQNFDEAAIFTIHGFCARVLSDRAFESAALFDLELAADQSPLLGEIADDFWRANFYGDDPLLAALLRERLKPENLAKLLGELTSNPALRVVPSPQDKAALRKQLAEICEKSADCEALHEAADRLVISVQGEFVVWARGELRRRKAEQRLQSYDDMLTRLDEALRGPRGAELRESLRARFEVALIDEFQDTDPIQYSILSQIYGGTNAPVFFIGDPKQAIYGSRGADVFAYLQAAKAAARRYTLGKNWRSEARLVKGVNALFAQRKDAFVIPGIALTKVKAAGKEERFSLAGEREQPLRIWVAAADEKKNVPRAVAGEIARLLASDTKIGDRKLAARDVAILVNNNQQPVALQQALAELRIPSVLYSAANVFRSREAGELLRVLLALAQPTREKIVRAALATEMLGATARELENLTSDETMWEATLNRIAEYHLLWRDKSFVEAMRALLVREKVRARLLTLADGERRLTNLLHLIELVHAACAQSHLGMDGVITWLARQQHSDVGEESELRLESDEDAVRIVTIHKSKGLEYGVTFYPNARKEPWSGGNDFLKFHEGSGLVLDLEKTAEHKKIRAREELAENARQLYVALTRAKYRSYVVFQEPGKRRAKSKSALAWLLSSTQSVDAFVDHGEAGTAAKIAAKFSGNEAIALEDLPGPRAHEYAPSSSAHLTFMPREFSGAIDRSWGIASFSSLISGKIREPETPDYDSTETPIETQPLLVAEGIHAFPGGTRAGTCLHRILEELDFLDSAQWRSSVKDKLQRFRINGFDEIVAGTIGRLLEMPLGKSGVALREIPRRLPELEFIFPLNTLT